MAMKTAATGRGECAGLEVVLPQGGRYPILIAWDCLDRLGALLRAHGVTGDVFVISDRTVHDLYGGRVAESLAAAEYAVLEAFTIPPGEESKTLDHWRAGLDRLVAHEDGTSRRLFVLSLGGGVVGDLGGFVAAAYRRGTPCVQVPTTLLAQVDSSVGGKTGVNHPGGKNLIGAYHQPVAVVTDLKTLQTLDPREVRSGLVEVMKYGLLWDADFFAFLEAHGSGALALEEDCLGHIVHRSCEIKAEVVGRDEREEKGLRTLLNLGHTFGHALEAATAYRRYTHGEAVGLGTLCAARVSILLGMLPGESYERIRALLRRLGAPTEIRDVDTARIWDAMKRDKKFIHGRNRFVLLDAIGKARVVEDVDTDVLARALDEHLDG